MQRKLVSKAIAIFKKGILSKTMDKDLKSLIRTSNATNKKEVIRMIDTGFLKSEDLIQDIADLGEDENGSNVTDDMIDSAIDNRYDSDKEEFNEWLNESQEL